MLTNADMTVYHYDEDAETYVRFPVYGVHWYEQTGTEDEKGGFLPGCRVTVRMSSGEPVSAGDYVCRGISFSESPDKKQCFKVMSITDNRESRHLPHRKLVCV